MIKKILKQNNGFTLIEIAIVLVIMGMLITAGARMIGPLTTRAKYTETKEIMSSAVESVTGFGTTNQRIPTAAQFPATVRTFLDAWKNNLLYVPDANLAAGPVCGRKTTALTVRLCSDAPCTTPVTISDVAFVIASGAANYNIQTGSGATINIYDPDVPGVDDYSTDMTRAEAYDDVAKWITLNELRIKTGCVGAQLSLLNTVLPFGNNGIAYNVDVYPEGGIPFAVGQYRWCVQTATGTLPAWMTLNPATTPISTNCSGVAEGAWPLRATLGLSGTPTIGTTGLTLYARDDNDAAGANDNIASKPYVVTINP